MSKNEFRAVHLRHTGEEALSPVEQFGPHCAEKALGLNCESRILCFSTEGDTDRENYMRIVGIPGQR